MLSYDQDSIAARLIAKTTEYFGDSDLILFGTNKRLFDLVAEELAMVVEYDEYLTRESKWALSMNYSSLLAQSEFYNYVPHRKVGATGTIRVSTSSTFNGSYPYNISIPKFSVITNGIINYATTSTRILSVGSNYVDITCRQGTPVTYDYEITSAQFPSGTDYATITIDNDSIEDTLFDVYVNDVLWSTIEHIRLAESGTQQVYTIKNTKDFSGVELGFGNDVFGQKLQIGDIVTFKGLETLGASGNVLKTNNLTTIEGEYTDSNSTIVTLYATNLAEMTGGSEIEELEMIRVNAPKSYQSGERAITRVDYATIILENNYADKVQVWGEEEVNQDNGNPPGTYIPKEENLVYISGFNIDPNTGLGTTITETQQDLIRDELNSKKSPTDIIQFIDTQFIYLTFHIAAFVSEQKYTEEIVRNNITTDLSDIYSLENGTFRKNLYFSNYQCTIDNIDGIDHHESTVSFSELFSFTSAYVFTQALNINNISPGSVKIYYRLSGDTTWIHMASDDAVGNIVGEPIDPNDLGQGYYTLPGAEINYADGYSGEITVTFGLDEDYSFYEIRTDFEVAASEEGDILLTKRQQIYAYYEDDVTVTFMDTAEET